MPDNPIDHESPEEKELVAAIQAAASRLVELWHPETEGAKYEAPGCFITINRRQEMDW